MNDDKVKQITKTQKVSVSCTNKASPSSDCEMHYSEEATFYSTAVSYVCTALCVLPSENRLLTVMHLMI